VVERPKWLQSWERLRHGPLHYLIECIGEFFGAFFYVYCGVGATAVYVMANIAKENNVGSLLTIGLGYAVGIIAAISVAGSVSGGHFNPCVSIAFAIFRGFPWWKVPGFIVFQVLGGTFACLLVYGQNRTTLLTLEGLLKFAGQYDAVQFTPNGIAGIFALYTQPGANLRDVFMNEFFVDFFLGLIIWGSMDPTNYFIPPPAAPWVIAFAYAAMIWGFSPGALAANAARDVGGRIMALMIWGPAAAGGKYAAIAALTNIPATLFAILVYELIFTDSSRVITSAQQDFLNGHRAHLTHKELHPDERRQNSSGSVSSTEKV